MTTDAESLAAAAADECRRILEEKDRLLTQARDERDAAREALREIAALTDLPSTPMSHRELRGTIEAIHALAAPVPPGETTPADVVPCCCGLHRASRAWWRHFDVHHSPAECQGTPDGITLPARRRSSRDDPERN